MKKKRLKVVLLAVLLLTIGISFGVIYTNAKYTSSENGSVSASTAKYVFNVNAKDSFNSTDTLSNLTLAKTCNVNTLTNGKIAPGTSGSFDIELDTNGSDVGIGYIISFTDITNKTLPTNLKFKLDGVDWTFGNQIEGTINAGTTEKVTHTITWTWDYETVNGDTQDTTDGINAFDYAYDITVVGTQVKPV